LEDKHGSLTMRCVRPCLPIEAKPNVPTLVDRNLIAYTYRVSLVVFQVLLLSMYSPCGQPCIISTVSKTVLGPVPADSSSVSLKMTGGSSQYLGE
jgi:hypothetical protein